MCLVQKYYTGDGIIELPGDLAQYLTLAMKTLEQIFRFILLDFVIVMK